MSEFKGVQLKRSTTAGAVPEAAQLVEGELAINLLDKKIYSKNATTVFELKGAVDDGTITTAKLASSVLTGFLNSVYPVGSQYVNYSNGTNPATLLGIGTWVAVSGRVVVGLDPADPLFDTAGETGGSKNTPLVSHSHTGTATNTSLTGVFPTSAGANLYSGTFTRGSGYGGNGGEPQTNYPVNFDGSHTHNLSISTEGTSGTDTNLQPYIVAYVWKRTA
jgi:hypothetical protein